jgi:hypothetical protein
MVKEQFFPLLLCCCSEIRDAGWSKNQDAGPGINIVDPQHFLELQVLLLEQDYIPLS